MYSLIRQNHLFNISFCHLQQAGRLGVGGPGGGGGGGGEQLVSYYSTQYTNSILLSILLVYYSVYCNIVPVCKLYKY